MRAGATLVETILALFLLTVASLVIIQLFHSGLRYESQAQRIIQATQLAQNTLDRMRDWATQPANFDSDWSFFTGAPYTDADFPGLSADIEVVHDPGDPRSLNRRIYSPCSAFEEPFLTAPLGARVLDDSAVTVRVRVRWGAASNDRVELFAHIGEPPRPITLPGPVLTRTGASDPIPPDQITNFSARFEDSGQVISDVTFSWKVLPYTDGIILPGNARLTNSSRDGRLSDLQNRYVKNPTVPSTHPDRWQYVKGFVGVSALARYRGRLYPPVGSPPGAIVEVTD